MITDEGRIDGSWELNVTVTDLQVERTLRVKGDLHIGGVMLRLVEALDISIDWSDHGLWWPEKNRWLTHPRSTLDQYGVQADAKLWFTPMHKTIRLQLPDLQIMEMRVDFSVNVFSAIMQLCKELKIRHPEEISLSRKLDREELKKNQGISATRKPSRPAGLHSNHHHSASNNSLDGTLGSGGGSPYRTNPNTPQGTLLRTPGTPGSPYSFGSGGNSPHSPYQFNGTMSPGSMHSLTFEGATESSLANSPQTSTRDAMVLLYKPKNLSEKARINAGWLDSSRSIMEQGVRENDIVLLRFKYFSFYDLNPKRDAVRINQIYEQAKWSLISEEVECTEEEMMMFAALQFQAQLQMNVVQPDVLDGSSTSKGGGVDDEISAALSSLEDTLLDGSSSGAGDITQIPKLQDYLRFFKPKKFAIKSYKKYFFVFEDTHLTMHQNEDKVNDPPLMKVNLKGCEVNPDINISSQKYNIKLFIPSPEGLSEVWIKTDSEQQYANWMAAFRLASKGKTMADSSYESEVKSLLAFLGMQHPSQAPALSSGQVPDLQPEDFVAPRLLRKLKTKQLAQRILEAHSNVRDMNLIESKLNYIKAWQALPDYGINYFIVKFKGSKKEELLGITYNKIIRMDMNSGDTLKTWRYSCMQSWHVNWEIKQVEVAFEGEKIAFQCLTADCKVVHEFIGGYIFLSMRSGDKNQALDEEMFHKLTGGWS